MTRNLNSILRVAVAVNLSRQFEFGYIYARKNADLVFNSREVLRVAWSLVRSVLYQHAQRPHPQRRVSVLLHHVQVRPVWSTPQHASLGDDGVDALGEVVLERGQSLLLRKQLFSPVP